MNKPNTIPFNLRTFISNGSKISDLIVFGGDKRKVTGFTLLGSPQFPLGIVVSYTLGGKSQFTQAFNAQGALLDQPDSSDKLTLHAAKTDLEVANERVAELTAELAKANARIEARNDIIRNARAENERQRLEINDLSRKLFLKTTEINTYINDLHVCGKDFAAILAIAQRTEAKYGTNESMAKVQDMARDKRELIQTIRGIV